MPRCRQNNPPSGGVVPWEDFSPRASPQGSFSRRISLGGSCGDSGASGAPEGSGDAGNSGNSSDSGASALIPNQFSVIFQGSFSRVTRLAARRAKPSFLLAGAVLSRSRSVCKKPQNHLRLMKNRADDASHTSLARRT